MAKQSLLSNVAALLWAIVSICFIVFLSVRFAASDVSIQTNMLELLPKARRDAATLEAIEHQRGVFTNNVAFLIGAETKVESQQAALKVAAQLKRSTIFKSVFDRIDGQMGVRLYQFYQPYRASLMTQSDQLLLQTENYEKLQQRILSSISSPGFSSGLLANDPMLFFTQFLSAATPFAGAFKLDSGMLTNQFEGRFYTLLNAEINTGPFSLLTQKQFALDYQAIKQWLTSEYPEATILSTGMIHNASAGTEQAKSEISTIGFGSLLGVLILFLISFASLRPALFALMPIAIGVVAAVSVCAWVFESIHIMTLVFGSSLIGVSIDYSLHFFAEQSCSDESDDSSQCLRRIMPGISLGLITSLIGYLAFFIAPFPGLQQMALFSSVGLTAAYCCVVFWFPYIPIVARRNYRSLTRRVAQGLIAFWFWHRRQAIPFVPLLFGLLAVAGLFVIKPNDDIRLLDNAPEKMQQDRAQFEAIAGIKPTSQFVLVSGATPEAVLTAEEQLTPFLDVEIKQKNLLAYRAISKSVPSLYRQNENYAVMSKAVVAEPGLKNVFESIGYDEETTETFLKLYSESDARLLKFKEWQDSEFFDQMQWLQASSGQYLSLVSLFGLQDVSLLSERIAELKGVQLVDQVADITKIFGEYRVIANWLVLLAYAVILVLLVYRYRLRFALRVLLPPVLAGAFAIAMSGFLGFPLTLFNTLALLLVLGIGIDYTLFFAENKGERSATMLGILLSAITTILSFGLLALSSTPALQSIGLTVLCGISAALLLSPMVSSNDD